MQALTRRREDRRRSAEEEDVGQYSSDDFTSLFNDNQVDLTDPISVFNTITKAITGRVVNKEDVRAAVEQTIREHETQLRVYMVAAAKTKMDRILHLTQFLEQAEAQIYKPERLAEATTAQLVRLYATSWGMLTGELDYIERVTKMGLEMRKLSSMLNPDNTQKTDDDVFERFPKAEMRARVLSAVEDCIKYVEEEEKKLIDVTPGTQSTAEDLTED